METIVERQPCAWFRGGFRYPEGGDIVHVLVVGRNLDQLDGARTPVTQWFDPEARAAFVKVRIILVGSEVAFALQEAEAPRGVVDEAVGTQRARVVQRPPDTFPGPGPDGEAVAVVYAGPPIRSAERRVGGEVGGGGWACAVQKNSTGQER